MASRSKKKNRLLEDHAAAEFLRKEQPKMETDKARLQQLDAEIKRMQAGDFSSSMARRQERFQQKKLVTDQILKSFARNGITVEDLDTAYTKGREEGFRQAAEGIVKCCYAGIVLALHDEFGFGETRCYRALKAVDERIIYALNHSEMVEEVLEKTGLRLDLDDPLERVQLREDGRRQE